MYKYLFNGRGRLSRQRHWTLFEAEDFSCCQLPDKWNYLINHHGDGVQMMFPVKMRMFLAHSPKNFRLEGSKWTEVPRHYIEKISILFVKVPYCYIEIK